MAWRKAHSWEITPFPCCPLAQFVSLRPWPVWAYHLAMQPPALAKLASPQTSGLSVYSVHGDVVGTYMLGLC